MKITVTSAETVEDTLTAKVTVPTKDVNAEIAKTYKDISYKYTFQGFRKGHVPRPVVDGMIGKEAVMAQATNALINELEPLMLDNLDVVPVAQVNYGDDPELAVEGKPLHVVATIKLRPAAELSTYDAPSIEMPPAEVTDAEIDEQVDILMGYHTSFEDIDEDRGIAAEDIVEANITNVENGEGMAGQGRMFSLENGSFPKEFDEQVIGMKKGDTKEVSFTPEADDAKEVKVSIEVLGIKKRVVPTLDDEFAKKGFGFDSVEALRDAVKLEIEGDKASSLPRLKEDRCVEALAGNLELEKVPEEYGNQVFQELAQTFLNQLQRENMSLDGFLAQRGIQMPDFLNDLHAQADERARQSLALDALARHLELEVTKDDINNEFKGAGAQDVKAAIKEFSDEGRMPAVRDSIKRGKAIDWLTENAKVTEVDEVAKRRAK